MLIAVLEVAQHWVLSLRDMSLSQVLQTRLDSGLDDLVR